MSGEIKQRTVYQIVRTDKPEDGTDVYVGSTSLSLKERLWGHRSDAKLRNSKFYKRMLEIGVKNWQIVPLVICPCIQDEIRTLERNWVELLKPDLNTISPVDTDNKWRQDVIYREAIKKHYRDSIESRRYYCDICDKAFGTLATLKKHLRTLKHSNNYMYSVD